MRIDKGQRTNDGGGRDLKTELENRLSPIAYNKVPFHGWKGSTEQRPIATATTEGLTVLTKDI